MTSSLFMFTLNNVCYKGDAVVLIVLLLYDYPKYAIVIGPTCVM